MENRTPSRELNASKYAENIESISEFTKEYKAFLAFAKMRGWTDERLERLMAYGYEFCGVIDRLEAEFKRLELSWNKAIKENDKQKRMLRKVKGEQPMCNDCEFYKHKTCVLNKCAYDVKG